MSGLGDEIKLEQFAADRDAAIRQFENCKQDLKRSKVTEASAVKRVGDLETMMGRLSQLRPVDQQIPGWIKPQKKKRSRHIATPVLMLSDLHFDEVVDLNEMDGVNAYNREIAERRFERTINKAPDYLHRYTAGVDFDGIMVPLMGDIITGVIHEELAKTNEAPVPDTIVHWVPQIAAGLRYLADEMQRVFVPCVDGNHDRTGKKIQYKNRAEESFAWIIYHWLADTLRDDDRITFSISQSPEQLVPVYKTNFLLHHGDIGRGQAGSGIGGIFPPIARWVHKKQGVYGSLRKPFDFALLGHWHQQVWGPNFIINGSMKGYDEYARGNSFGFEVPKQNLFLVTPERGITLRTSIDCD
jgi:hypothetical protein